MIIFIKVFTRRRKTARLGIIIVKVNIKIPIKLLSQVVYTANFFLIQTFKHFIGEMIMPKTG